VFESHSRPDRELPRQRLWTGRKPKTISVADFDEVSRITARSIGRLVFQRMSDFERPGTGFCPRSQLL
jgi:hypothetical protein